MSDSLAFVLDRVDSAGGEVYSSCTVWRFSSPLRRFVSELPLLLDLEGEDTLLDRPTAALRVARALLVVLASSSSVRLDLGSPRMSPSVTSESEEVPSKSPGAEVLGAIGVEAGDSMSAPEAEEGVAAAGVTGAEKGSMKGMVSDLVVLVLAHEVDISSMGGSWVAIDGRGPVTGTTIAERWRCCAIVPSTPPGVDIDLAIAV